MGDPHWNQLVTELGKRNTHAQLAKKKQKKPRYSISEAQVKVRWSRYNHHAAIMDENGSLKP